MAPKKKRKKKKKKKKKKTKRNYFAIQGLQFISFSCPPLFFWLFFFLLCAALFNTHPPGTG